MRCVSKVNALHRPLQRIAFFCIEVSNMWCGVFAYMFFICIFALATNRHSIENGSKDKTIPLRFRNCSSFPLVVHLYVGTGEWWRFG